MKIVLCNGDSLGMPRENVLFEDTWFFRLSNSLPKEKFYFINNFRRANTTNALVSKDFLDGKHLFIDPGKRSLLTMMDDDGNYFSYTNKQRIKETKRIKYSSLLCK